MAEIPAPSKTPAVLFLLVYQTISSRLEHRNFENCQTYKYRDDDRCSQIQEVRLQARGDSSKRVRV
jgi:hypothetical protein